MGFKRDRHRLSPLLPGPAHYLAQHVAVRSMNAIKVPDADHRWPEIGGNIFEFVKNVHLGNFH